MLPDNLFQMQIGKKEGKWACCLTGRYGIVEYYYLTEKERERGIPSTYNIMKFVSKRLPQVNPSFFIKGFEFLMRDLRGKDFDDDDSLPKPHIFKPPSPPDDLAAGYGLNLKQDVKKDLWDKPYCKHCGSLLAEGELTCPNCGKKT